MVTLPVAREGFRSGRWLWGQRERAIPFSVGRMRSGLLFGLLSAPCFSKPTFVEPRVFGRSGADGGGRTRTGKARGILSPLRLPVLPRPHASVSAFSLSKIDTE